MSAGTRTAGAINFPDAPATVLMAASDLSMILSEIKTTRAELDALREDVARERAIDRRRITALEREEPQPLQKDRGEILRSLLAANGGKMLAKEARKRMHLSESRFSELLKSMDDTIEKRPYHLNRSALVLVLK